MGRAQFRVLFSMIAAIGMVAMALPVQAGKIFWMEPLDFAGPPSKIFRADLDGSNQELVLWIDAEGKGMQVDADNHRLYWSVSGEGIHRGNADGCDLLIPGHHGTRAIELDLAAGKIYWLNPFPDGLIRADLDGSNVELLIGNLHAAYGLALDLVHGKVYWTEYNRAARADLDGSNVETVVDADARAIAVDPQGGKLYWTQVNPVLVRRADLDGSNAEDLASLPAQYGQGPWGVDLDRGAGKLYWAAANADGWTEITRANLDGSDPEVVLLLDTLRPAMSLAVVSEGDGVSPFTCESVEVPALGKGAVILLTLLLLAASGLRLRASPA